MGRKNIPSFARLLFDDPLEFLDRAEIILQDRTRSLLPFGHACAGEPKRIGFKDGIRALSTTLGRDLSSILDEAELHDIENHVRILVAQLEARPGLPCPTVFNADSTLTELSYLLCRALQPETVVETGVAYGVTSAAILAALQKNDKGTLHSIDLPPIADRASRAHIGIMIPPEYRHRWRLHLGASKRVLPRLLATSIPKVDLFVHDSANIDAVQRMEMATVWPHMPSPCAMIVDAIQGKRAFGEFVRDRDIDCCLAIEQREKTGYLTGVILLWPGGCGRGLRGPATG